MEDDRSIRDILPSVSDREESVSSFQMDHENEDVVKSKILKPTLKSDFSSKKLLMHQNDRYEVKNMEQGMFAKNNDEEEGSQMYLKN